MTALELHRKHPELELTPILRVIKYMGFDSNALAASQITHILRLYPYFERDPELVVGTEAVAREAGLEAGDLEEVLRRGRGEIPYLGTAAHPMVPAVAIGMIRAVAAGRPPLREIGKALFTLTEIGERTGISLSSLSKYVRDNPGRVPFETVGKMRKFPIEAVEVFHQIKAENLGRRSRSKRRSTRQKAAVSRRFAGKLAALDDQVNAALEASRDLTRTLSVLSRTVRRALQQAENGSVQGLGEGPRPRRSGGQRPNTIVAACKQILSEAGGDMRVADITARVIAMGTSMRAKNPNVTVSSILSSYDDFVRVRRGYYKLSPTATLPDAPPRAPTEPDEVGSATGGKEADAVELLADLRAAAGHDAQDEPDELTRIGLEPFGATG